MRIFVKARPSSKIQKIEKIDDNHFVVSVKEPPAENKANDAITKALSRHLGFPSTRIQLVRGKTSKQKVFKII